MPKGIGYPPQGKRRLIQPSGVDVQTLERAMSPAAARLAVQQSSRKSPLALTQDDIDIFEMQASKLPPKKHKSPPSRVQKTPDSHWEAYVGGTKTFRGRPKS